MARASDSHQWIVTSPTGRVERLPNRQAARDYARSHGGRKAGYHSGEYRLRVEPKLRAGVPLAVARGHRRGNAVVIPKHRTRKGYVIRKQWTIGATESGEELTLARTLRRLRAFLAANPDLETVGVAIHGRPYRDREAPRWTGFLWDAATMLQDLEDGIEEGMTEAREIPWANRPLWVSIDEITYYRPGEL